MPVQVRLPALFFGQNPQYRQGLRRIFHRYFYIHWGQPGFFVCPGKLCPPEDPGSPVISSTDLLKSVDMELAASIFCFKTNCFKEIPCGSFSLLREGEESGGFVRGIQGEMQPIKGAAGRSPAWTMPVKYTIWR